VRHGGLPSLTDAVDFLYWRYTRRHSDGAEPITQL
jgi:hypothetical protein